MDQACRSAWDGGDLYVVVNASGGTVAEAYHADALLPPSFGQSRCGCCEIAAPRLFMLHDELWSECGARADLLCFSCAEARLGRPFTAGDFTSAPVNGWVFDAFAAGFYPNPARTLPEARLRKKQSRMEVIRIPATARYSGFLVLEAAVPWFCIHCCAERGEPVDGFDYDGSRPLAVTKWLNACGHTNTYEDVRAWVNTPSRS